MFSLILGASRLPLGSGEGTSINTPALGELIRCGRDLQTGTVTCAQLGTVAVSQPGAVAVVFAGAVAVVQTDAVLVVQRGTVAIILKYNTFTRYSLKFQDLT